MSLISYKHSQTSIILRVKILDSAATTGAGKTGRTEASAGLIISTIANNEAAATTYTATSLTIETIAILGTYAAPTATMCRFQEVDSTNHKGVYEIQIADARFAIASAKSLLVSILGATDAAETDVLIPLTQTDPYTTLASSTVGTVTTLTGHTAQTADHTAGIAAIPTTAMRGTDSASTHAAADVWTAANRALSDPAGFKKNTAATLSFTMFDTTLGTLRSGEAVTATRSIDGAAFAACANPVAEIASGAYKISLDATDLNGDMIILLFTSTNTDDHMISIKTET